jgi:hypothetical protein
MYQLNLRDLTGCAETIHLASTRSGIREALLLWLLYQHDSQDHIARSER